MANEAIQQSVNFNDKHLRKGEPLPPYNGKLRVYSSRVCPFAQRTILALLAKNVDFEVVNVHLADKPEWLFQKSAFGKVPSIEIKEDVCIYESLITVEYMDDVYPQRPLLAKDPITKAYDKIIAEATGMLHTIFFKFIRNETITDENIIAYKKTLHFLQDQLKKRKSKFFDGNEPGYADYMVWPWLERFLACQDKCDNFKLDDTKFKLVNEYVRNMLSDPAVSLYLIPKDVHLKFFDSYGLGVPKFDIMSE